MPLTLIKSDCYIAVAFDHFTRGSAGKERNVRIIFRQSEMKSRGMRALHESQRKSPTNNFIVKREFVIIVDHIFFAVVSFMLFCSSARLWTVHCCLSLFFAARDDRHRHDNDVKNLWFQWFIYCVWLFFWVVGVYSSLCCRACFIMRLKHKVISSSFVDVPSRACEVVKVSLACLLCGSEK